MNNFLMKKQLVHKNIHYTVNNTRITANEKIMSNIVHCKFSDNGKKDLFTICTSFFLRVFDAFNIEYYNNIKHRIEGHENDFR